MVFGQLFQKGQKFGKIFQDATRKFSNLYDRAQQIPEVKAKLDEFNVPQIIEKGKQAFGVGQDLIGNFKQLLNLGREGVGLLRPMR